jgi:hypothetical protein
MEKAIKGFTSQNELNLFEKKIKYNIIFKMDQLNVKRTNTRDVLIGMYTLHYFTLV